MRAMVRPMNHVWSLSKVKPSNVTESVTLAGSFNMYSYLELQCCVTGTSCHVESPDGSLSVLASLDCA